MRSSVLKYMLVVSLLLNFSLLGAAAYTYFKQPVYRSSFTTGHSSSRWNCNRNNHLFRELSLKPGQVKVFQQKADEFHAVLAQKRQEVDQLRNSLIKQMASDVPDSRAIDTIIAQINGKQEEMQKMVVAHMLEFKSMLTQEQQKKFLNLIEGAMVMRQDGPCP